MCYNPSRVKSGFSPLPRVYLLGFRIEPLVISLLLQAKVEYPRGFSLCYTFCMTMLFLERWLLRALAKTGEHEILETDTDGNAVKILYCGVEAVDTGYYTPVL